MVFEPKIHRAIGLHGTALNERFDLNDPLPIDQQFDLVCNIGTLEHIFNQHQAWKSIHELTKPGGLMFHSVPNQGAYDHCFYNYHPTFFFDLGSANDYTLQALVYVDTSKPQQTLLQIEDRAAYVRRAVEGKLVANSGLIAVFQKAARETLFKTPQQGYYDKVLPPDLMAAWEALPK